MNSLLARIADTLDRLDREHLRRRLMPTAWGGPGRVVREGTEFVDFSSNDYLGLARHPLLARRAAEWTRLHGAGAGASRLVTGTSQEHRAVEQRIAAFKGTEAALLFASGWQLNAAVLAALLKLAPDMLLFTDRLVHASLHAGATGHRQIRFRHNDMAHLETLLERHREHAGPRLIVTESVFSMDGDRADLGRLSDLARTHGAFLYVDEAHATGVLGPGGSGLSAALPNLPDLVMGTFSKAMGSFGAYVAGSQLLIDFLVNCASGFLFSTALPPPLLGSIDAALDLVPAMEAERDKLASLGRQLREALTQGGLDTGASSTHIVPVIVGDADKALALARDLQEEGLMTVAIRPPTVPPGTSRLRIALRTTHEEGDVARLAEAVLRRTR